jgi:hypothetical protein
MAVTFNSSTYALQVPTTPPKYSASANAVNAKLRYAIIPYSIAGTEVATDLINLVRLKPGDIVIPSLSRICHQDIGTAFTLDIGFASNDDALMDGVALGTSAGDVSFTLGTSATATAQQYVPVAIAAGDEVIYATVKTATTITAAAKILFIIAYVSE